MLKWRVLAPPIRLLAADIDGTLLNSQFKISERDLQALQRAHRQGVEVVLVTGRRHTFALPIAQQLGFDLWLISSNGAITRSLRGETFYRHLMSAETCRRLCSAMREYRGNTVLTFDTEEKGAIVIERMDQLNVSIQRWLEKNMQFIEFVIPIEKALTCDPVQAAFFGSVSRMAEALPVLSASGLEKEIAVSRTEYAARDLSMLDVLSAGCSKGSALARWAQFRGIPREQVMAVGDNYNDMEMLAFAGKPYIMGNAPQDLRRNGWTSVPSNDECGLAAAVEEAIGPQH